MKELITAQRQYCTTDWAYVNAYEKAETELIVKDLLADLDYERRQRHIVEQALISLASKSNEMAAENARKDEIIAKLRMDRASLMELLKER